MSNSEYVLHCKLTRHIISSPPKRVMVVSYGVSFVGVLEKTMLWHKAIIVQTRCKHSQIILVRVMLGIFYARAFLVLGFLVAMIKDFGACFRTCNWSTLWHMVLHRTIRPQRNPQNATHLYIIREMYFICILNGDVYLLHCMGLNNSLYLLIALQGAVRWQHLQVIIPMLRVMWNMFEMKPHWNKYIHELGKLITRVCVSISSSDTIIILALIATGGNFRLVWNIDSICA